MKINTHSDSRLIFIRQLTSGKHSKGLYQCTCGNQKEIMIEHANSGHTKSCGCFNVELVKSRSITHGKCGSRLYLLWRNMLNRCYFEKHERYKDYGARGIVVCAEWHLFEPFKIWAESNGYNDSLQIDREEVNGNYTPKNCRFVTRIQNANNKRNTVWIEHNGEKKSAAEWAKILNINCRILYKNRRII